MIFYLGKILHQWIRPDYQLLTFKLFFTKQHRLLVEAENLIHLWDCQTGMKKFPVLFSFYVLLLWFLYLLCTVFLPLSHIVQKSASPLFPEKGWKGQASICCELLTFDDADTVHGRSQGQNRSDGSKMRCRSAGYNKGSGGRGLRSRSLRAIYTTFLPVVFF